MINEKKYGKLPDYTRGEEMLNTISHAAGAVFGVIVLVLCLYKMPSGGKYGLFSSLVYGISMILLYAVSATYHGFPPSEAKRVLRVVDHCTIYLLISGTYTPAALCALYKINTALGWGIFALEWGLAVVAITLTAVNLEKTKVFSMICYIAMGWCLIAVPSAAVASMGVSGFGFVLGGGIAYTIGAVFYGIGKKVKYIHGVFHLFVLAGSILQFVGVYLYII